MTDVEYGALWFVLIVAVLVLWAVYTRLRYPKSACRCGGGRIFSSTSSRWRDCPRCKGSGVRDIRQ